MRLGRWYLLAVGIAAAACASTIGPVVPSIQVVVVLDSLDDTLRIIPVDSPSIVHKVVMSYPTAVFGKHALALNGSIAAISHGGAVRTASVVSGSGTCDTIVASSGAITSLTFHNGYVYAAVPQSNSNSAPRFAYPSCDPGGALIRGGPRAFVSDARGVLFAVTGSNAGIPTSWLSTTGGQTSDGSPLLPQDSIALSSPGHAQGAVLAADGFVYVINAGNGVVANARLSQVDPVQRVEQSVYNGFGTAPQYIATDGERVFVASEKEGLMVYNTRTKQVERDYNSAIPLLGSPRGIAADDLGRVYALVAGSCGIVPGQKGAIRIFGADLAGKPGVTVGTCPVAIGITDIPSTLYNFKD